MVESVFLEVFGNKDVVELLDFLIENKVFNYKVSELKINLNKNFEEIMKSIDKLIEFKLIYIEVFNAFGTISLDLDNQIIKKLIEIDLELTKIKSNKLKKRRFNEL